MSQELMPYSATRRDRIERQLAVQANKRELILERRHGLDIIIYWLKSTNQVSMQLLEGDSKGREFLIPNDLVLDARDHPEAYAARAGMPRRADELVD